MSKTKKQWISILILFVLVALALGYVFGFTGLKAQGKQSEKVIVEVEEGFTYQDFVNILKEEGLIGNKIAAKVQLKLNPPKNLQVNTYELNKSMDFKEMIAVVENGDMSYVVKEELTIPEGYTVRDMIPLVAKVCNVDEKEVETLWQDRAYIKTLIDTYWFLTDDVMQEGILYPLEGYLYPETYVFNDTVDIDTVTRSMLNLMDEILLPYKEKIEATEFNIHQFLTFASIVERESLHEQDHKKIAGVFMNRLHQGMKLQSDITVLYALNRTGIDVSYEDLEVDSPYNTYKYEGLPIGPISSVSLPIIEACLDYEHHDNLYFYACPDGTILYATTLEEHEANVEANPW